MSEDNEKDKAVLYSAIESIEGLRRSLDMLSFLVETNIAKESIKSSITYLSKAIYSLYKGINWLSKTTINTREEIDTRSSKLKSIKDIVALSIRELLRGRDKIAVTEIIEYVQEKYRFDEKTVRKALKRLIREGEVYEPEVGYIAIP